VSSVAQRTLAEALEETPVAPERIIGGFA
jgi:hypothetical protein